MAHESARVAVAPAPPRGNDKTAGMTNVGSWLSLGEAEEAQAPRGEIVLVLARWVLIVVGIGLALNSPQNLADLQVTIVCVLTLAMVNFWLHTNLVMGRSASRSVLYWTSAADTVVIAAVVAISGGSEAYAFAFCYPAILTFSLVFPFRVTAYLTGMMTALYAGAVLLASQELMEQDPEGFSATLAARLISFVAVMAVANMYRWVEYRRIEDESKATVQPRRASRARTQSRAIAPEATEEA